VSPVTRNVWRRADLSDEEELTVPAVKTPQSVVPEYEEESSEEESESEEAESDEELVRWK
jgi:hypothetical protein